MKAIIFEHLAMILLVAAGIIVLGSFVYNLVEEEPRFFSRQTCKASMLIAAYGKYGTAGERATRLKCPREEVVFEKESVKEIQKQTAEAILDCVTFVGLNTHWAGAPWIPKLPKAYCVICKVISFEGRLKNNPQRIEIMPYLQSKKIIGGKLTYTDFFASQSSEEAQVRAESDVVQNGLDTSKRYAIFRWDVKENIYSSLMYSADVALAPLQPLFIPKPKRGVSLQEVSFLNNCVVLN